VKISLTAQSCIVIPSAARNLQLHPQGEGAVTAHAEAAEPRHVLSHLGAIKQHLQYENKLTINYSQCKLQALEFRSFQSDIPLQG
jgi:hypothetical protein